MINQQRTPIVELAFEDVREIKKRERILQKIQAKQENHKKEGGEDKPKFKPMSNEDKNAEKLAKLKLDKLLDAGNQGSLSEVKLLMKKIKSRGLKQRLNKRISQTFKIREKKKPVEEKKEKKQQPLQNSGKTMLQNKKDRKEKEKNKAVQQNNNKKAGKAAAVEQTEKAKPEKPIKVIRAADATPDEEAQLVKSIQRMIKNNKKSKRRAEDHDEFDVKLFF